MSAEASAETARVALVTGAARGIGRSIAIALAREGATVVGADLRDQTETGSLVTAAGGQWIGLHVDLADPASVAELAADLEARTGALDVLVNNAAIDDPVGIDELDVDRWRRVLRIDLDAPFELILHTLPLLRRARSARIVNIASGSVVNPMKGFVAYRAAKSGLIGLTRALAMELGREGITVNAVSPGVTLTEMAASSLSDDFRRATIERQAVGRPGTPEDVAETVAFLASERAAFVTGQTVMVNGGAAFT